MPVTRRQLARLAEVITKRTDISDLEKPEFLSILEYPEEAADFLADKFFDPYFPQAVFDVLAPDGKTWTLVITPHARIEVILDGISEGLLVKLFTRILSFRYEQRTPLEYKRYIFTDASRQPAFSMVTLIQLPDTQTHRALVVTAYAGRPKAGEPGARVIVSGA